MFDEIKEAARGRCAEINAALTCFPGEIIAKKGQDHPCPQCGGQSKAYPDTRDAGANRHGRISTSVKYWGQIADRSVFLSLWVKLEEVAKLVNSLRAFAK